MAVHRVSLSSIDQLMPLSYIRLYLVVKTGVDDFEAAVRHLQQGLTLTQQQLPYIGGVMFETASHRIGIEWRDGEKAPQIQVVPVSQTLLSSMQSKNATQLFSDVWRIGSTGERFGDVKIRDNLPALTVICSRLDSHLVLGVSCFHSLWDIAGLSVFLHLWSKNTSRIGKTASLSVIEDLSSRNDRLHRSLKHINELGSTSFRSNLETAEACDNTALRHLTLCLDASRLRALSQRLSPFLDKKISVNDLAVAVIWASVSLNRCNRGTQLSGLPRLRVLVDGRKHVFRAHELKTPYLGNLALPLFAYLTKNEQPPKGFNNLLLAAIGAIQSSSQHASSTSFVEAISMLDKTSDASTIRETSAVYNTHQLTSTSWAQAPMYVDFGTNVGKVEYIRIGPEDYQLEGMILTLPRKRDGSKESNRIEIFVTLERDELHALRKDEVIRSLRFDESQSAVALAKM